MSFSRTKRLAHLSVITCSLAYAFVAAGCGASTEGAPSGTEPAATETPAPEAPVGDTPSEPGTAGTGEAPSTTPPAQPGPGPQVLSTLPAAGALGVRADTKIVLKFDRAMDTDSVIAAYASVELPAAKVTFTWSAASDELTITPGSPLTYAVGDPQTVAKGYAISIAKTAKDKGGLAITGDFALSFSTLRKINGHVPNLPALSGRVLSNGATGASPSVGDFWSGGVERQAKAFLTFDLTSIPKGAEIGKATLSIEENTVVGTPDVSLGGLDLHQVFFTAVDAEAFGTEPVAGTSVSRILLLNGPAKRLADTTSMVQDDLANRGVRNNRTQVRLTFPDAINGDGASDFVSLDLPSVDLAVQYLAP